MSLIYHRNMVYEDSINNIFLVNIALFVFYRTGAIIIKRKINYDLKGMRERRRKRNKTMLKKKFPITRNIFDHVKVININKLPLSRF